MNFRKPLLHLSIAVTLLIVSMLAIAQMQYQGETVNTTDANLMRQGKWIIFGNMTELEGYKSEQVVEVGKYINNKKEGIWTAYFPNGKVKTEINFEAGRPKGSYKVFYDNGQVQEQGNWVSNRNVGEFKRYHENGKLQQEFNFDATGKRAGVQKYYHENGQIMIEGNWNGGKESGEQKRYYENGDLKSVQYFDETGKVIPDKTKEFEPKKPNPPIVKKEEPVIQSEVVKLDREKTNIGKFDGNGFNTTYNKDKQISQVGQFKGGRMWDGKIYVYNKNGILKRIEIYKNGKYFGNGVIDEELTK